VDAVARVAVRAVARVVKCIVAVGGIEMSESLGTWCVGYGSGASIDADGLGCLEGIGSTLYMWWFDIGTISIMMLMLESSLVSGPDHPD
jgi:hypothetical protein